MCLGLLVHTCSRISIKKIHFMHGKKVLSWEVQFMRKNLICVRKHKLLHVTKSTSRHHLLLMCATGLPSSGPSLHAVIFFNKFFIIIFYQNIFEKILGMCVFFLLFFLENFEKKFNMTKVAKNSHCLFFSFFWQLLMLLK